MIRLVIGLVIICAAGCASMPPDNQPPEPGDVRLSDGVTDEWRTRIPKAYELCNPIGWYVNRGATPSDFIRLDCTGDAGPDTIDLHIKNGQLVLRKAWKGGYRHGRLDAQ